VLRQFYRFGTVLVPRFVLYAVLFTVMRGFLFFIVVEMTIMPAFVLARRIRSRSLLVQGLEGNEGEAKRLGGLA